VDEALGSNRAEAGLLALDVTGSFGPTSTLGGTPFGVDTPYSFRAVFDPTDNVNPTPGAGYFRPTQFTIEIAGHGTFTGIPNVDLNVVVLDPSYHLGVYAAGLVTSAGDPFFLDTYSTVVPSFNPEAPTPTSFSGYLGTLAGAPYMIRLAGGTGDLVIKDFGNAVPTASLVAVPVPSSLVLAGLGGLALFAGRTRLCRVWAAGFDHRRPHVLVYCTLGSPPLAHRARPERSLAPDRVANG
jgi:hypothetical protein